VGRSEIAQFASCCDSNSVFFRFFSGVTTGAGDPTRAAACAERMSHRCACRRRPRPSYRAVRLSAIRGTAVAKKAATWRARANGNARLDDALAETQLSRAASPRNLLFGERQEIAALVLFIAPNENEKAAIGGNDVAMPQRWIVDDTLGGFGFQRTG